MNPLETVAIGKQGVEVTRLGFGGAPLSGMVFGEGLYGGTASDEAVRIIRRALSGSTILTQPRHTATVGARSDSVRRSQVSIVATTCYRRRSGACWNSSNVE